MIERSVSFEMKDGISPDRPNVTSKEQFINLFFDLSDHNDKVEWENESVYSFLQAMAAWLNDADGFYKNIKLGFDTEKPSWQLFADMLLAATVYE